jgi:hypothetical protein
MQSAFHGALTPPALGRACERWANYGYSICKFDRNIATFVNAPSTHAYCICGFDTFTTGGSRPPLLVASADAVADVRFWPTKKMLFHSWLHDVRSLRKTTFAMHKRTFTRAAGVSPPWQAKRDGAVSLPETEAVEHGEREPAVAFRTASASAVRRTSAFGSRVLSALHGGLTPPARGCMRDTSRAICVSDSQRRMCPTAGLRQPLQVGNASAGRMMRIPAASSTGTSLRLGTRPAHMRIPAADSMRSPQLAHAIRSWLRVRTLLQMCDSGRRKRRFSTGAYTPRSWSGMRALRESCVFQLQVRPERRCVRERAQHTCVFQLWIRCVHHGWRMPSAPGCVCGRCCKCATLADGEDTFFHGWLTPAARDAQCRFTGESDIRGAQTHIHKSGGREPAVASETRLRCELRVYPETNTIEHSDR